MLTLNLTNTGLLALALSLLYMLLTTLHSYLRLRHIPGPPLASISYLWLLLLARSCRTYQTYRDLPSQYAYSPLIRVGPNEIMTSDATTIRQLSSARTSCTRDAWYEGGRWNGDAVAPSTLFCELDTKKHDALKAKMASAYGGHGVDALEPGVDKQVGMLVRHVRERHVEKDGKPRTFDLARLVTFFTVDVITKAGFGRELGLLRENEDKTGFVEAVQDDWPRVALTLDVPWIRNVVFSPLFLRLMGPKRTDKSGMGKLMGIARDVVTGRFDPDLKNVEKDMIASFIQHGMTQDQIENETIFMLVAGSETTASVLRLTFLYLMASPRVYRRLKDEIRRAVHEGTVSHPIRQDEARKLPYLQAVLYEGLRMRSPAPGLYAKKLPPEGDTLCGVYLPGGTTIGMNTSALLRDAKVFRESPELFWPERFLDAPSVEAKSEMERTVELVFGTGRWMCAGKNVAFMELNKVIFEMFREFDLQIADPGQPWLSESFSVWVDREMCVTASEAEEK